MCVSFWNIWMISFENINISVLICHMSNEYNLTICFHFDADKQNVQEQSDWLLWDWSIWFSYSGELHFFFTIFIYLLVHVFGEESELKQISEVKGWRVLCLVIFCFQKYLFVGNTAFVCFPYFRWKYSFYFIITIHFDK